MKGHWLVRRKARDNTLSLQSVSASLQTPETLTYNDGKGDTKVVQHAPVAVQILSVA